MPKASKLSQPEVLRDDWRTKSVMALPTLATAFNQPSGMTLRQPDYAVQSGRGAILEVPNKVAVAKRAALSGWGEPPNLSVQLDATRLQAAIRASERGDTWQLFTIFRDMVMNYTHLQNEFAKRKLTVVGQPHAIIPWNKGDKDDEKACKVIGEMIEHCDNWMDAMDNLLDATLWPVAVAEKIFAPIEPSESKDYEFPVRYRLRKIDPVSPTLFCYKIPYLTSGFNSRTVGVNGQISPMPLGTEAAWNPDDWEPELRLYEVFENGYPNYSPASSYQPTQDRHVVHRGTNLSKTIRDNFGGHMRAIVFWWFLATQSRDWFGRYMQKWGHPFIVGKVDVQQKDTVAFMREALSMSMELGGLVIDKEAEAQMLQAASLNGAEGYRLFLEVCNEEVSKVVVGQVLSSTTKPTGLGSGVAHLHSEVRQDYRQSDMRKLSEALTKQLFRHYLRINGYKGHVRGIIWGGKDESQATKLAITMRDFSAAGLEADDAGIQVISERVGFGLRRAKNKPQSKAPAFRGGKGTADQGLSRAEKDLGGD
jgi:hypothetical protein